MGGVRLVSSPVIKTASFPSSNTSFEHKPQFTQEIHSHGQVDLPPNGLPQFVRHEESTTIELFYDLFFVANLTTFTSVHEVNSRKTLTSYIGFFCVLWFTWCQTSLYDVRFMADSWLERVAKACHLGVMVGLSVVGPNYDTEVPKDGEDKTKTLKVLALILMGSRLVLAIQYCVTAFHLRNYKKTKLPVLLHALTNFIAAIIYIILAFALSRYQRAYRAFYVIAVAEMVCIIFVSSFWKVCSFKGTHLVERMSLLTLYILGEGVIDILKSTGKLAKVNNDVWTGNTVGVIIAAITTVYLLYMLYFDCLNHKYFGSIRQQIWSFAHFPFHAVLVLAVTGMAQLVVWYKVVEATIPLADAIVLELSNYSNDSSPWTDDTVTRLWESLSEITLKTTTDYPTVFTETDTAINGALASIQDGFQFGNQTAFVEYQRNIGNLLLSLATSIFKTYGFEAGGIKGQELEPFEEYNASIRTIAVVFIYFFIAAGFTIIILGTLSLIMDTHKSWRKGTVLRFVSHFLMGLALALVCLVLTSEERELNLMGSPWIIPIFTFTTAIVLAFHHIKWGKRDKEHDINEYAAPENIQHVEH